MFSVCFPQLAQPTLFPTKERESCGLWCESEAIDLRKAKLNKKALRLLAITDKAFCF